MSDELYYFTGKPCKNGHISKRLKSNRSCVECLVKRTRLWRTKNKNHIKEYTSKYHKANPLVKRISQAKRRMNSRDTFTIQEILDLYIKQNGKCVVCAKDLNNTYHIDHAIPLSRGGSNSLENIQLLCPSDNIRKNNSTTEEYLRKLCLIN